MKINILLHCASSSSLSTPSLKPEELNAWQGERSGGWGRLTMCAHKTYILLSFLAGFVLFCYFTLKKKNKMHGIYKAWIYACLQAGRRSSHFQHASQKPNSPHDKLYTANTTSHCPMGSLSLTHAHTQETTRMPRSSHANQSERHVWEWKVSNRKRMTTLRQPCRVWYVCARARVCCATPTTAVW